MGAWLANQAAAGHKGIQHTPSTPAAAAHPPPPDPAGRWSYYRKNNKGHNTLTFGKGLQQGTATLARIWSRDGQIMGAMAGGLPAQLQASTPLTNISTLLPYAPGYEAMAMVDLSALYVGQGVVNVTRTFLLPAGLSPPRSGLLVEDAWSLAAGAAAGKVALTWAMHTTANCSISQDGHVATLQLPGPGTPPSPAVITVYVFVRATASCSAGALRLEAVPVRLQAPQYPTDGLTRLQLLLDPTACSGLSMGIGPTLF